MTAIEIRHTCSACPDQYEIDLEDGRMVYVRYRHGEGSIRISDGPTNNVMDAAGGSLLLGWEGRCDGSMDEGELEWALDRVGINRRNLTR